MRILKYAILGLINRKSLTGYDITKEFNSGLVDFWYANHSQIYPELKKLTDECLISYKIIIQGEKLEKKLYTITEEGKVCLQKWLKKDEPLDHTPKDVFRLKAYFCDEISNEDLVRQFKSESNKHSNKLKYLENTMEELLNIKDISTVASPQFGDYIVLNGAIMREKAYLDWTEDCIKKILK